MEQCGREEVPRESIVGRSRVSIMSRQSQQHTNGSSRPRGAESRLPGTSHSMSCTVW